MAHPITSTVLDEADFNRLMHDLEHPIYNPKAVKMFKEAEKVFKTLRHE